MQLAPPRWATWLLGALLIAATLVAVAPSASAHQNFYPYGRCDQRTKLFSSDIRVAEDPSFRFPPNGTGGGVVNSYYNRLGESIAEWNRALRSPESNGVTKSFRYVGTTRQTDVLISYGDDSRLADGRILATTFIPRDCGRVHPPDGRIQMPTLSEGFIRIVIRNKENWFTQEQSERTNWENCLRVNYNAYSCSKVKDIGSTFVHEFMHVMGLMDLDPTLLTHLRAVGVQNPEQVLGQDQQSWAKCGNPNVTSTTRNMAVLCPVLPDYSTSARVFDGYDFAALRLGLG